MKHFPIVLLVFLMAAVSGISRADTLPDDGYDYAAGLSAWKSAFTADINSRTNDNGIRKYTQEMEWVTAPFIKNGTVVGRHRIWQINAYYAGEYAGKTFRATVNEYYVSSPEPGPYLSIGELKSKFPQAEKKRVDTPPDDLSNKFTVTMDSLQKQILRRRSIMLERGKNHAETKNIYETENRRLSEKWADSKMKDVIGAGRKDKDGGINFDTGGGYGTLNPSVSQDELLAWEMANSDKARSDWEREYRSAVAADEKAIETMVADYLALKKGNVALTRIRAGNRETADDNMVKSGMVALEKYPQAGGGMGKNPPVAEKSAVSRSTPPSTSELTQNKNQTNDIKNSVEDMKKSFEDLGNTFKGIFK